MLLLTVTWIGEAEVPVTERGELWMHYTEPVSERTVPAWKVLEGRLPTAEMERLIVDAGFKVARRRQDYSIIQPTAAASPVVSAGTAA